MAGHSPTMPPARNCHSPTNTTAGPDRSLLSPIAIQSPAMVRCRPHPLSRLCPRAPLDHTKDTCAY